jgi:hypothetical protein
VDDCLIPTNPLKAEVFINFVLKVQPLLHSKHTISFTQTNRLMLLSNIIAVYSENYTKPINTSRV